MTEVCDLATSAPIKNGSLPSGTASARLAASEEVPATSLTILSTSAEYDICAVANSHVWESTFAKRGVALRSIPLPNTHRLQAHTSTILSQARLSWKENQGETKLDG